MDHMKKLKNNTFVGNSEHFRNEIESTECLETLEDGNITPLALQMMRLKGFSHFSPISKKCGVRPPVRR